MLKEIVNGDLLYTDGKMKVVCIGRLIRIKDRMIFQTNNTAHLLERRIYTESELLNLFLWNTSTPYRSVR